MKFPSRSILSLVLATGVAAAPAIQAADAQQPAPIYPIGFSGGSNAKVAGRLFDIDGKVEYFAGNFSIFHMHGIADIFRIQCMVACAFEQQLRCRHSVG